MEVTLLGMVIKVNPVQPENRLLGSVVTFSPIFNAFKDDWNVKALVSIEVQFVGLKLSKDMLQP